MTFNLFFTGDKEILYFEGKEKVLKPLEISNSFLECLKLKDTPTKNFINDFHAVMGNEKQLSGFSAALQSLGLQEAINENDYIFPEAFLSYANPNIKNDVDSMLYEALMLHWGIKLWLQYDKKSSLSPSKRFGAMDEVLDNLGYRSNFERQEFLKFFTTNDSNFTEIIGSAYYSFNERTMKVKNRVSCYKGKSARLSISDSLIALAWSELEYYIEKDSLFKSCFVCGDWFLIRSKKIDKGNKKACGSKPVGKKVCSEACRGKYKRFYEKVFAYYKRCPIKAKREEIKRFLQNFIKSVNVESGLRCLYDAETEYKKLIKKERE
jgi:hypothetical protein